MVETTINPFPVEPTAQPQASLRETVREAAPDSLTGVEQ